MCTARLQAVGRPKPGLIRPGRAGPKSRLGYGLGPGFGCRKAQARGPSRGFVCSRLSILILICTQVFVFHLYFSVETPPESSWLNATLFTCQHQLQPAPEPDTNATLIHSDSLNLPLPPSPVSVTPTHLPCGNLCSSLHKFSRLKGHFVQRTALQ